MNKFLLLIKISRPLGWLWGPAVFSLGLLNSGNLTITPLIALQIFMLSFPLCILVYGINDIYDYETDKINPRKKLLEGIKLEPECHSYVKNVSFLVIALLFLTSFLTLNASNILGMLLLVFFAYFYSAPRLRFKERPPLDSISNGMLYFFAPFLLGFSLGGGSILK
jgi:4-hydroxybenzoate polyprenyltransferase